MPKKEKRPFRLMGYCTLERVTEIDGGAILTFVTQQGEPMDILIGFDQENAKNLLVELYKIEGLV